MRFSSEPYILATRENRKIVNLTSFLYLLQIMVDNNVIP